MKNYLDKKRKVKYKNKNKDKDFYRKCWSWRSILLTNSKYLDLKFPKIIVHQLPEFLGA